MKDNFAIVKVKNHKLLENGKNGITKSPQPTKSPNLKEEVTTLKPVSTKAPRELTTTVSSQETKELVSRKPTRSRGRLVKKVKSRGQINQGVLKNMKDQKSRRRLQFIKRGKAVPKSRSRSKSRVNEIQSVKEKPRISVSIMRSISQSDGSNTVSLGPQEVVVPVGSIQVKSSVESTNAHQKEEEADRRVAELTHNILELKAQLDKLRLELQV